MSSDEGKADDGGAEFLEQARWLLEWHHQRGVAITTRATAVLGFVGVVLALLLQAASIDTFDPRWWTWLAGSLALGFLLLAGIFAVLVFMPRDMQMPSVGQLRRWWSKQMADSTRGSTAAQISESILIGEHPTGDSPISAAKVGADKRAYWFKRSALALLGALGSLTVLVADVLIRVQR